MKIDYADAILKLRAKLKLSQEEMAKLMEVSPVSINRWENAKCEPTKLAKVRIIQLLKENNVMLEERE